MSRTPAGIANISLTFHTNNDDKDADTHVQCNILPYQPGVQTSIIATYSGDLGGHLDDDSTSRSVSLGWWEDDVWFHGSTYIFQVIASPNGHDTWRFDAYLFIMLRGNPIGKTYPFLGHALSQNVRSNDYLFVL